MKIYHTIFLALLLLLQTLYASAQKKATNGMTIRNVEFIVRNGDYIKNIASRIRVSAHDIVKANKLRSSNYLAYPGRRLLIPVRVQPKVWDPTKEEFNINTPSKEDRGKTQDYELLVDSTNYYLSEDLINMEEARADSIEYAHMEDHISKLDKRIKYLYYKIDSFKQVDFKFDYDDKEKNAILAKMKSARDKFYFEGPLGKQIDSLKEEKDRLGLRRIVLRNLITEYEYLSDNASYQAHNFKQEEKDKPSDWGQHLAYDSRYVKNGAKGKYKTDNIIPASSAQTATSYPSSPNNNGITNKHTPEELSSSSSPIYAQADKPITKEMPDVSPAPGEAPTPIFIGAAPSTTANQNEIVDTTYEDEPIAPHYKTDFALLTKQKFSGSISASPESPKGLLLLHESQNKDLSPASSSETVTTPLPVGNDKNTPKYLIPVDSTTRSKGDFYLIRARQMMDKGDFKTGDKYLRKSLDINPNNAEVWMLHADLLLTMGAHDQSLKEYIISGEIDSTNPKVFYNIALLYTKSNNSAKALKYFSKAIQANDKYILAYMGRASLVMDAHDYQGAIRDYDKVISLNKYFTPAYQARGLAKMEIKKFIEAIEDFNKFLEIEEPDGFVIYQKGMAKIYAKDILHGCLDLSTSQSLGFKEAEKAIKKFCE